MERWRPVVGWEGLYEVSSMGRVRSLRAPAVLLRPRPHVDGYRIVTLSLLRHSTPRTVHRLVLEAFVGLRPPGKETGHRNGKRADNRLSNLRWVTRQEQEADKRLHAAQRRKKNA